MRARSTVGLGQKLQQFCPHRSFGRRMLAGRGLVFIDSMPLELLHGAITEPIIGAFFDVHLDLGYGFHENVYRPAIVIVLRERGLQVDENARFPVFFRGRQIAAFHPDLVINQVVVVELKAQRVLEPAHEAQVLNYLKASEIEVGLLLNFGPRAEFKRFVFDNAQKLSRDVPPSGKPPPDKSSASHS
jgi:GxxExxY protein